MLARRTWMVKLDHDRLLFAQSLCPRVEHPHEIRVPVGADDIFPIIVPSPVHDP